MLLTSPLSSPLKNPVRDVFSPAPLSNSLLWDDSTAVLWDDGSKIIFS